MATGKNKLLLYSTGFILVFVVFLSFLELTTRIISLCKGNGFFLNLSEKDAFDESITGLYIFHPFAGFIFRPNLTMKGGVPDENGYSIIYTDNNGFLFNGTPIDIEKKDDEIRIATIGASTTASINLNYEQNWPGLIQLELQQRYPGRKFTIINAGVPGYDTSQNIGNLALRVMPFRPDIVIIYQAYNDLKAIRFDEEFKPDYSHIHKTAYGFHTPPPFYKLLLEKSMLYVRTRNKYRKFKEDRDILTNLNSPERMSGIPGEARHAFEDHIRSLVAIARSGGARVILSSFATLHDPGLNYGSLATIKAMDKGKRQALVSVLSFTPGLTLEGVFKGINLYNRTLSEIAGDMGTGWVDNANLIPHEQKYFVDRVHFSSEGAILMGKNFLPEIEKIIREKLSR